MTLRDHMREILDRWPAGVPQVWRDVLGDAAPNFDAIPVDRAHDAAAQPAYPPLQTDNRWHLSRAFRGITPDQVRVVVIGQDPYPARARATGRAFEDGAAHARGISDSLKRLLQSAIAPTNPDFQGADQRADRWAVVEAQVREHLPDQGAMERYFDGLAGQGVLFLNAAWTFTDRRDRDAHLALWQPVALRLIENLAARDQLTVFVLFGRPAQCLLSRVEGVWRRAAMIPNDHPAGRRSSYFNSSNPLVRANSALRELREPDDPDAADIIWWPPPRPANAE